MTTELSLDLTPIATELGLNVRQVERVVELLQAGNTVPFITRYRKEQTGNLDEESIRAVEARAGLLKQLAERAASILKVIDSQGKLTPELRTAIESADTLKRLEDLYLPYRPKRRSRAQAAREKGLEPFAEAVWSAVQDSPHLDSLLSEAVRQLADVETLDDARAGVADLIAERISEVPEIRDATRAIMSRSGRLQVTATPKGRTEGSAYSDYFEYSESIRRIPPHRVLAINRGERDGYLRVKLEWDTEQGLQKIADLLRLPRHPFGGFLKDSARDALSRLLHPSLEREFRREATDQSEQHAVDVFARNLRNLLLQPPLQGQRVLAIDPGFRTGCKVVVLDELGVNLVHDLIYVTGNADKRAANQRKLEQLLREHDCHVVAIGNGTACRETEELVSELAASSDWEIRYAVVNEAGASIYSTSSLAREEFPELDATARGTISIGRRLQDPLSELVKIDPQHIGVGMYQHDVNPKQLQESLEQVVESCVNYVGVDLNTASPALLKRVSGFNQLIARRVVEWRTQHGRFQNRRQLLDVPGVGDATFTQSAGFLRIVDGSEPLDNTWIHPESYETTYGLLKRLQSSPRDAFGSSQREAFREKLRTLDQQQLAGELHVGLPTLKDILQSLEKPGLDPRTQLPPVTFRKGILKLEDLAEGMKLQGTVLNVVDFGAFVDIGLKDSGLVHISKMSHQYVRSPHEIVSVGDSIAVWVIGIDKQRRRVSLSMVAPSNGELSAGDSQPPEAGAKSQSKPEAPHHDTRHSTRNQTGPAQNPADESAGSGSQPAGHNKPLRGFDELRQAWNRGRHSEAD